MPARSLQSTAQTRDWLVFTWDGVGYGEDGTLWGGETFVGRPGTGNASRACGRFRLPGGDKAGRAPWRSAAALCWETGRESGRLPPDPDRAAAWEKHINAPQSSAAGRLFDAAAAIVLGIGETSFEGTGPDAARSHRRTRRRLPELP